MVFVVTGVFEIPDVRVSRGHNDLSFRLEILRSGETALFHARLSRWESYRIQPSFPQKSPLPPADEEVLVQDALWDWREHQFPSEREALAAILSRLREKIPGLSNADAERLIELSQAK